MKASSSTTARTAPARAVDAGISRTAAINSQIGRATAPAGTSRDGTPKSSSARREPGRSASFASAATTKTAARPSRAAISTVSTLILARCGVQPAGGDRLRVPHIYLESHGLKLDVEVE